MSRRCHHGSPRHAQTGRVVRRPSATESSRRITSVDAEPQASAPERSATVVGVADVADVTGEAQSVTDSRTDALPAGDTIPTISPRPAGPRPAGPRAAGPRPAGPRPALRPVRTQTATADQPAPELEPAAILERTAAPDSGLGIRPGMHPRPVHPPSDGDDGGPERTATAPQLRRFIKSRAYVPMHELRRRFGINGGDDEVTPVDLERSRVFVGLPEREGRLLGELLRGGDIGYELSLDPITPIVVGVYPMRPVTRG
jgi:hypothetical protein